MGRDLVRIESYVKQSDAKASQSYIAFAPWRNSAETLAYAVVVITAGSPICSTTLPLT
jgi:hypothetical protein